MTDPEIRDLVRSEARRQVIFGIRRFVPLALVAATVATLVAFAPDQHRNNDAVAFPGDVSGTGFDPSGVPGAVPGGDPTLPGGARGTSGPGGTGGSGTPGGSGSGGTSGNGSGQGNGSSGAGKGIATNGTRCTSGARQFSFSVYAPLCQPKFTGSNGGATAQGVTATTITLAIRKSSDYDAGKLFLGLPPFEDMLHDLTVLTDVLNKQYELYGRKVVIKSYKGKGGILSESQGQGQASAAADAQTSKDLGAFASGVGPPDPMVFQNALSSRGIISLGLPGPTAADFKAAYPFQFPQPIAPIPDVEARGASTLVCQRLSKLNAINAGDASYRSRKRSFGLIISQTAAEARGGRNQVPGLVKSTCGESVKTYTFRTAQSSASSDSKRIATQMKADGITTALLMSNLQFAPAMTSAAVQNAYLPEWFTFEVGRNSTARQMNATAVKSMVFVYPWRPQSFAPSKGECYRLYKMGDPGGEPRSDSTAAGIFDNSCANLLQVFGSLQAAGPTLTPAAFGAGWFRQAPSNGGGDFGRWAHDTQFFSPLSSFTLQTWSPSGTNPYDGAKGSYVACREPKDISYLSSRMGSGQLRCLR